MKIKETEKQIQDVEKKEKIVKLIKEEAIRLLEDTKVYTKKKKTQNTFVRKKESFFYLITQVAEPNSTENDGIEDLWMQEEKQNLMIVRDRLIAWKNA